jgi:hypothetical protein
MEQPSPVSPVLKGRPWVNYLEKKKISTHASEYGLIWKQVLHRCNKVRSHCFVVRPKFSGHCPYKKRVAGGQWLPPVILATQETEIRRIMVGSQPRQIVHEILS